ncbi:MAG: ribosome maturation factor RimP [Thermoleophilia bacterium]|nr:ribosome maturation factor RimP [Thermoleophilia bacterium]
MKKATIIEDVEQTLAKELPDVDVVDVEVGGGGGNQVLRVFIDHPDGVDHELCTLVTGLLGRYQEDHTVEVSSPGLEKRLRKPGHFRNAVGQKINVKTFGPVEGRRNFTGFLFSADGEKLELELDDGSHLLLPLEEVAMARTVFEFDQQQKPRKQRRKKSD